MLGFFPWFTKEKEGSEDTLQEVRVTYYWSGDCGQVGNITSTGSPAKPLQTCAVDTKVYPYGSKIEIPEMGINIIFGVEDIEKTLDVITKNGGKVHTPKYQITPEIGFAAEFLDCFGNRLGLFSPPES